MESYLITAILGAVLLSIVYWISKWTDNYWKKRGVKYIRFPPFLGSMKDIVFSKKGFTEIYYDIYKQNEGEKFVGYFQFLTPSLLIRDPELINQVFVKDFSHFEDRSPALNTSDDLFSRSFSNYSGDSWRNLRTKLAPSFSTGKMKSMVTAMNECGNTLVDYLKDKTNKEFAVRDLMMKVILNANGKIAFGLDIDTLNEKEEMSVNFLKNSTVFFSPSFSIFVKFLISLSLPMIRQVFKLKMLDEDVDRFFRSITKDAIKHRYTTGSRRNDFLQLLIDQKEKEKESKSKTEIFTDDFISAQAFLFISAGSETIATVLEFILYEMAVRQDLQKKVQDEISTVLTSNELTYESLNKLTYMEQFINETLRLHPVAPTLFRLCTRDYKIPGTEVVIKKGNFVHIAVDGLQTDPQYFHDPEKFDPERFADMDSFPKNVYYPFGAGPRICIGMRLGMFQLKMILAILLSNYSFTLNKRTQSPLKMSKVGLLVHAEGGVWVNFHRRETCLKNG